MDRTEMLYCIHQKRRQAVLQPALQVLKLRQEINQLKSSIIVLCSKLAKYSDVVTYKVDLYCTKFLLFLHCIKHRVGTTWRRCPWTEQRCSIASIRRGGRQYYNQHCRSSNYATINSSIAINSKIILLPNAQFHCNLLGLYNFTVIYLGLYTGIP